MADKKRSKKVPPSRPVVVERNRRPGEGPRAGAIPEGGRSMDPRLRRQPTASTRPSRQIEVPPRAGNGRG